MGSTFGMNNRPANAHNFAINVAHKNGRGRTVAHEIGHIPLLDDHRSSQADNNLMYYMSNGGKYINNTQCVKARKTIKSYFE